MSFEMQKTSTENLFKISREINNNRLNVQQRNFLQNLESKIEKQFDQKTKNQVALER